MIDASAGTANFAVAVLGVSAVATDDVVGGNLVGTDASGSRIDLSGTSNAGPGLGVVLAGFVVRRHGRRRQRDRRRDRS